MMASGGKDGVVPGSGDEYARSALSVSSPLTATAPLLLHTQELSWEALEHLVVALAVQGDQAVEARPFGRNGQAQDGIDVVAFFASGPAAVYQAKKYERFAASDLRKAVLTYAKGSRPFGARRLVIVTTADVRDTKVDLELARLRGQHQDLGIDLWGRQQLSDMLFTLPDLVRRFFGEHTMQVFCRPLSGKEEQADSARAADHLELEDYSAQLDMYLRGGLHELVPLTLADQDSTERMSSAELAAWLRPGRHVQVVGASGTGKSHTLTHTVLGLLQAGWLAILLRASVYEGQLNNSLDECVSPFSQHDAQVLVQAARQRQLPIVLLVDAVNECPSRLQERLIQQVSSWCLRVGATVVISSQKFVHVPAALSGARLRTADPDPQQRTALLRSHRADQEVSGPDEEDCATFDTAFELSLAAQLAQRLPRGAARAALLEAHVGEQLQHVSQPTVARQVLHRWALMMDERLTGWLPLAEARRSAAQLLAAQKVAVSTVDEALKASVVRVRHQRVEFRHEWYAQLLAAEALMWRCAGVPELAGELGRPHRRELAAWAVALHSDPEAVRGLLRKLPETEVLTEALHGRLGPLADEAALAEARHCLQTATEAAATSQVVYTDSTYTVRPTQSWSAYEQAVFHAVGTTARDGRLLEPLARLLRETDQAVLRGTVQAASYPRDAVPRLIAAVLSGPIPSAGDVRLPAEVITDAARLAWPGLGKASRHQPAGTPVLQRWITSLDDTDVGLTVLLCYVLQRTDDPTAAALASALFTRAWNTGANHLRFAGLDLLTNIRTTADEATTAQIIELLHSLHPDDVFVSTMLVEALHRYGQITSPYAAGEITEEITSLLTDPNQPDAHTRAQRILESQFEEVIAAPYVEAIDALDPNARHALLVLAVREGDATLFTDVFLKELIRAPHPGALPALQHWAAHLRVPYPFWQDAVSCHLLGIEGCAAHLPAPPPLLDGHQSTDADAWRCYGHILFWLNRPGLSTHERDTRCAPLWEQLTGPFLDAAVDPLHQFQYAAMGTPDIRTSALVRIIDAFPAQARTVLHHGLHATDQLTSLLPHPRPHDRTTTAMRLLTRVGDHSSLPLLAAYRDHPTLGSTAADTIRHINNRTTAES
ncbi:hypothetical protein [Streptomyces sp. V1I6]|uniref:hypothetical protein n=1 Tax=Streptomyces sp. V1I6 TaxID=3042273 RepID=UPI00278B90BA|nr:hypothetical protein [Streptomyces sp. V1I6]MDQ0848051.1 putative ABC-type transport system involved in lysophospholipase L1 biosynthesis ATPase subunit [Streptomyces sp. V1I6]